MKVEVIDTFHTLIYLNFFYADNIDFEDKKELEKYFRKLFQKLDKCYNIGISGYYDINVYIDKYYGVILDLKKDDIEFFDLYNNQVDMRITIKENANFLYEISDVFNLNKKIKNKIKLYNYNNKLYLQIVKPLKNIEWGFIMENCIIKNDEINEKIIKNGKVLYV